MKYEENDKPEWFQQLVKYLPAGIVMAAVGGFFTLAWVAYHSNSQALNEDDIMTVQADAAPLKEKPQDPGGMHIPHQDKTVYETFSTDTAQNKAEQVLPSPEEPIKVAEAVSETKTWVNEEIQKSKTTKVEDLSELTPAAGAQETQKVELTADEVMPPIKEKAAFNPPEEEKEKPKAVAAPMVKKAEKAPATPKPVAKAADSGAKGRIQLGAYTSEKEALNEWARLQKKFSSQLSGKKPVIERTDLGVKGVFFRLQTLVTSAKSVCASLSAAGQGCLVK